jgi:hypothetical protein
MAGNGAAFLREVALQRYSLISQRDFDGTHYPINILHHSIVPESNHFISLGFQIPGSLHIIIFLFEMPTSIQLNHYFLLMDTKSTMSFPMACCLLKFTPFSLSPRSYAHSFFSAGVSSFLNSPARYMNLGVGRFAGMTAL